MDFSAKGTTKDAACLRRRRSCTPPLLLDSTSNQSMVDLEAVGIRSYIAERDRGRRGWSKAPDAQRPVYRNRRRMRGPRGRQLIGNAASGSNARSRISTTPVACVAHHLRGHQNILKRL